MSPQNHTERAPQDEDPAQRIEREADSVANKLSKELSNWRRKRTGGRPHRHDGPNAGFQSAAARTIKVRGHETLVVRKSKATIKPPANTHDSGH
jgi:hypothetical protein